MSGHETELSESESLRLAQAVREALARRRMSRQALADAARISLSTLEKALSGRRPFTLTTLIRLEEALGVSLRGPGNPAEAPRHAPESLGAYSREAVTWLEGRYLTLRPSFGDPRAIFAYRTEILWDPAGARLVFREADRLDAPFAQTGEVSVPNLSGTIYLMTNWQGQLRLAMLGRPTIHGELYGILTTLHAGRGAQLTPAACPLALVPDRGEAPYGRITPDLPAYAACRRHLARICEEAFAVIFPAPG
ncbi:helix-turn-helix domain-containing protein [Methylobacterium nodulans]|uniref:Transcriptional regulator, XRE family n=1 Tax=Methylobacterium nodulans (strain LMG 21967 / CNCM I-2342 / ORS 2060) TaxID=460265 RepID=B8IP46_METNO|nr:helix-turn-helix transcriptional regulator [Methylobacterium nodulans]ACL60364.1 transcriptional regulator, XRE family [Methylobacterium nodulans ORS 2060]